MPSICFYFKVHQPYRLKPYSIFDIGNDPEYFLSEQGGEPRTSSEPVRGERRNNAAIIKKVARKCYDPTNAILLELLEQYPEFKFSFSLSGVFLEQLLEFAPETLESFRRLAAFGRVELLGETFYHSLSFLKSEREFIEQIRLQEQALKAVFGLKPRLFSNTEAAYNNDIARIVRGLGYKGLLIEGADRVLEWRSPNYLYHPPGMPDTPLLLKNYRLSDDIAFRFSEHSWSQWPLTAPKYASWISAINGSGDVVNIYMDFETFGEHQWQETGIFEFLRHLPEELLRHPDNRFLTPSEVISRHRPVAALDIRDYVTWADTERDLSAWLENPMQRAALDALFALEPVVRRSGSWELLDTWRKLQTSDHFYYMCTKWFADGDVHKYFNPYDSPYEAYITYMNVLNDFKFRLKQSVPTLKINFNPSPV